MVPIGDVWSLPANYHPQADVDLLSDYLNARGFRIGCMRQPPYVSIDCEELDFSPVFPLRCSSHRPGFDTFALGLLVNTLAVVNTSVLAMPQQISFTDPAPAPNASAVGKPIANYTSVFDALRDEVFDTTIPLLAMTERRLEWFEFSYPIRSEEAWILMPKGGSDWLFAAMSPLRTFSGHVWMATLCTAFALIIGASAMRTFHTPNDRSDSVPLSIVENVWMYFRCAMQQCIRDYRLSSTSGRLLLLTFSVLIAVISTLYQNSLLYAILFPVPDNKFAEQVSQLTEMMHDGRTKMILGESPGWIHDEVQNAKAGDGPLIREALLANEPIRSDDVEEIIKMVTEKKYIYLALKGQVLEVMQMNCTNLDYLEVGNLRAFWSGMVFRKGFLSKTQKSILKLQMLRFQMALERCDRISMDSKLQRCKTEQLAESSRAKFPQPVALTSLVGLFAFVASGGIIGALMFAAEVRVNKVQAGNKRKLALAAKKKSISASLSASALTVPRPPRDRFY